MLDNDKLIQKVNEILLDMPFDSHYPVVSKITTEHYDDLGDVRISIEVQYGDSRLLVDVYVSKRILRHNALANYLASEIQEACKRKMNKSK